MGLQDSLAVFRRESLAKRSGLFFRERLIYWVAGGDIEPNSAFFRSDKKLKKDV